MTILFEIGMDFFIIKMILASNLQYFQLVSACTKASKRRIIRLFLCAQCYTLNSLNMIFIILCSIVMA